MDEKNLLLEQYGVNVTTYYNELASNLNDLAKKTLNSISAELKKLEIFDEATVNKGVGYLDKRLTYSLNKNLDVLETYAKENFFDIENTKDLRSQFEANKENISKGKESSINETKTALEKDFQEYRKQRNLQMLDKLIDESKNRFQQSIENLENQYKVGEFEKYSSKNGIMKTRIKNLETFVSKLQENNDELDNLLK